MYHTVRYYVCSIMAWPDDGQTKSKHPLLRAMAGTMATLIILDHRVITSNDHVATCSIGTWLKSYTHLSNSNTWNAETCGWTMEVYSMFNVSWYYFIDLLHNNVGDCRHMCTGLQWSGFSKSAWIFLLHWPCDYGVLPVGCQCQLIGGIFS